MWKEYCYHCGAERRSTHGKAPDGEDFADSPVLHRKACEGEVKAVLKEFFLPL